MIISEKIFELIKARGMNQKEFTKYLKSTLPDINKDLPNYARLKKIEIMSEAFERTPKKSIKRYLYQRRTK